jgi:F-box domain
MDESKRQKRSPEVGACANPLRERAILQQIFSYVGLREWLYIAGVCSGWRALYLQLLASQPEAKVPHFKRRFYDTVIQIQTTHAAALASVSRLELALQCGLSYSDRRLVEQAGAMCTRERLQQLIKNGLGLKASLCTGAARAGRVRTLTWLKQQRYPLDLHAVCAAALRHAHLQVLDWVRGDFQLRVEVV